MNGDRVRFFAVDEEFADLREPILEAVEAVFRSGRMLQGEPIARFEERLASMVGRAHAVAVNSCTDALAFVFLACGIGPGDEVLLPDFSFAATASSVLRVGATPVFVDIDESYDLDLDLAATAVGARTRAIVHVDLYGRMRDPRPLEAFARRHGLLLVEDAAQALLAVSRGRPAGSIGTASCFSFDPTKPIGAPGSGGAVLTDDDAIARKVRALRVHGKRGDEFATLGFNAQMSSLVAAVLDVKLDCEERWLLRRRQIAEAYTSTLSVGCSVQPAGALREHVFHKYVLRTERRDELAAALDEAGIDTLVHYPYRLHELPFVRDRPHRVVDAGAASRARDEVLSLPIHPYLTDAEVERVAEAALAALTGSREWSLTA